MEGLNIHLWVEEAHRSLDDADGLVVDLHGVNGLLLGFSGHQNGHEAQSDILRVHLIHKAVLDGLLLTGGDFNVVLCSSQITHDLRRSGRSLGCSKMAANVADDNRARLIVAEGEGGSCRVTIDELDAKDFAVGEGSGDCYGEIGSLRGGIVDVFVGKLLD